MRSEPAAAGRERARGSDARAWNGEGEDYGRRGAKATEQGRGAASGWAWNGRAGQRRTLTSVMATLDPVSVCQPSPTAAIRPCDHGRVSSGQHARQHERVLWKALKRIRDWEQADRNKTDDDALRMDVSSPSLGPHSLRWRR
jgi:hypothetical protein